MEEVPNPIKKRDREASDDSLSSPGEKRLRSDLLLGIFDDDVDAGSEDGLASVMKSLEAEIGLPLSLAPLPTEMMLPLESRDSRQSDLGYLLEASDDELGLPPTVPTSSDECSWEPEKAMDEGLGQIWGFTDDIPEECYDGLDLPSFRFDERDDAGFLDGDLFGCAEEIYPLPDLSEISWRTESLPAVQ